MEPPEMMPVVTSWAQVLATVVALIILVILVGLILWMRAVFRRKLNNLVTASERLDELVQKLGTMTIQAESNVDKTEQLVKEAEGVLIIVKGYQELAARQRDDALRSVHKVTEAVHEVKETAAAIKESVTPTQWRDGDPDRRTGSRSPDGPDALRIPDLPPPPQ